MPYKKGSIAEQAGKVRRTAKRRIARLEKEITRTASDKERNLYRQQIDVLRKQIQNTYQRNPLTNKATGFDEDSVKMAVQNLTRTNISSKIGTSSQARKNFLTQQELNTVTSVRNPLQTGEFTAEEVSIFYRATQRAWEGAPSTANKNQLILEYYGEKDLREFVRKVLSVNEEAIAEAHKKASPEYRDESEAPQESDQRARTPSKDWAEFVNMLNKEAWSAIRSGADAQEVWNNQRTKFEQEYGHRYDSVG